MRPFMADVEAALEAVTIRRRADQWAWRRLISINLLGCLATERQHLNGPRNQLLALADSRPDTASLQMLADRLQVDDAVIHNLSFLPGCAGPHITLPHPLPMSRGENQFRAVFEQHLVGGSALI